MAEQLGKLSLQEQFDRLTKQKQALDTDDQGIDVSTSFLPSGEPLASDENTTNTVPAQQQVSGSDRPSWDGREQSKQQRESWDVLDQPEQLRSTTGAEQAHSRGHGGADQSLPDSSGRPSAGAVVPPLRLSSAGPADASCSISAPGLSAAGDLPGQQTCQASDEWTELSERSDLAVVGRAVQLGSPKIGTDAEPDQEEEDLSLPDSPDSRSTGSARAEATPKSLYTRGLYAALAQSRSERSTGDSMPRWSADMGQVNPAFSRQASTAGPSSQGNALTPEAAVGHRWPRLPKSSPTPTHAAATQAVLEEVAALREQLAQAQAIMQRQETQLSQAVGTAQAATTASQNAQAAVDRMRAEALAAVRDSEAKRAEAQQDMQDMLATLRQQQQLLEAQRAQQELARAQEAQNQIQTQQVQQAQRAQQAQRPQRSPSRRAGPDAQLAAAEHRVQAEMPAVADADEDAEEDEEASGAPSPVRRPANRSPLRRPPSFQITPPSQLPTPARRGTEDQSASGDGQASLTQAQPAPLHTKLRKSPSRPAAVPLPTGTREAPATSAQPPADVASWWLLHTSTAHDAAVSTVALHPSRPIAVTAGDDKTWRVWHLPSRERIMIGQGHTDWVAGAAFHPEGAHLATASGDANVKLWSFAHQKCVATLKGHAHAVWGVAWHDQGSFLASCSLDQSVRIWDFPTGSMRQALRGHADSVNSVAWQPYSGSLATASADKSVCLWDARSGLPTLKLYGHAASCNCLAFMPQGDTIVSGDAEGILKTWDLRKMAELMTTTVPTNGKPVNNVCFDPSGTVLAVTTDVGKVFCFDAAGMQVTKQLSGHSGAVSAAAFSKDGDFLLTVGSDCSMRMWGGKNLMDSMK